MSERDSRLGLPSASGMDRIAHCPGSPQAEAGLSELPADEVQADGLLIHSALETDDDDDLGLSQKQIAENLRSMDARELDNWRAEFGIDKVTNTIIEGGDTGRFWIRNRNTLDITASARPDKVYVAPPFAYVLNWKTGFKRPTPSQLSWQSRTEVVATWHELGCDSGPITHIRGAFLSSRISSHFDATDYGPNELRRADWDVQNVVWRTQQQDAPRVPGPWCRYCRAAGVCRENATYAGIVASGVATVPGRGGIIKADELQLALKVAKMTPGEIGYVYRRKSVVEAVFDAMAARLRSMPAEQLKEAGYALGDGRPVRSVNDGALAFKRILGTLTEDERIQCVSFSYTKAAEILAARAKISEDEAKTRVLTALGDSITEKESVKRLKLI